MWWGEGWGLRMGETDREGGGWRIARILFWWGTLVACVVALVQASGSMRPWSIVVLGMFGAGAATTAVFEHGWHRASTSGKTFAKGTLILIFLWGGMAVLGSTVWPKDAAKTSGFTAEFRVQFVNIPSGPKANEAFFGYLTSYGLGQQLSPVSLLTFINLRSLYSYPVGIRSYAVFIETHNCEWTALIPLDTRAGNLLFLHPPQELTATDWVLDTTGALDSALADHPLEPHTPLEGMLLFATSSHCIIGVGDTMNIRLELRDSENKSTAVESGFMPINRDTGPVRDSVSYSNRFVVKCTGIGLETSNVTHRNAADPLPSFMDMDSMRGHVAVTVKRSPPFGLSFPDGTYIGRR